MQDQAKLYNNQLNRVSTTYMPSLGFASGIASGADDVMEENSNSRQKSFAE
jgi:hypothetical protein